MKRFMSFVMAICLIMAIVPVTTYAAEQTTDVKEGFYYIELAGRAYFMEVDPDEIDEEGQPIRFQEKIYGRQSQVFYLTKTEEGWVITCYESGKILDVKDGSKKNYAQIVQNKDKNQKSGKWEIVKNNNGTVSFRNIKSGLYLNVYANDEKTCVQYENIVSKFNLYRLDTRDLLGAEWKYMVDQTEIVWSEHKDVNIKIVNDTEFQHNNAKYYPTPGEKYIVGVEYIDANSVTQIAAIRKHLPKFWEDVKNAVDGKLSEDEISELLESLGFTNSECIENGLSVLEILWQIRNESDWDKFLKAALPKSNTSYSGVIVLKNYIVTERGETVYSTTNVPMVYFKIIETVTQYSFASWNESEHAELKKEEGWNFFFK